MKSITAEDTTKQLTLIEAEGVVASELGERSLGKRIDLYFQLTKPRITFLIVLVTAAAFRLASDGEFYFTDMLHSLIGITLLASGISALNQYIERDIDLLMKRTESRPLPSGKLLPIRALVFGVALTILAEIYLTVFVNPLTALLGVLVIIGYLFCYTPLKTRTPLSTLIGAIPGAMPPLLGWTSARPEIGPEAWSLFAIMFYWQIPHFLAIAKMYREDYKNAGILMLPVIDEEGNRTARQIIISALILIPISMLPTVFGITGVIYFYGALLLGLVFLYQSTVAARSDSKRQARRLLLSSVLYLPALFMLMIIDQV